MMLRVMIRVLSVAVAIFGFCHDPLAATVPAKEEPNRLQYYGEWIKGRQADRLPRLARDLVSGLLNNTTQELPIHVPWNTIPVGLFVTAMKGQKVRTCVGTFDPAADSLSEELLNQCKRLVSSDPRHPPLDSLELPDLKFFVTLTGTPQPVQDPQDIDLLQEGLSAEWEGQEAVLLPGEAKTLHWGLTYLKKQIGVPVGQNPRYSRFPVLVFPERRIGKAIETSAPHPEE